MNQPQYANKNRFLSGNIHWLLCLSTVLIAPAAQALYAPLDGLELISDPAMKKGIRMLKACDNYGPDANCPTDMSDYAQKAGYNVTNPFGTAGTPVWDIGQWNSQSSIPGAGYYSNGNTTFSYADANKGITFHSNGAFEFNINGKNEFKGGCPTDGTDASNMIFSQYLIEPYALKLLSQPASAMPLSKLSEVTFSATASITWEDLSFKNNIPASCEWKDGNGHTKNGGINNVYFQLSNLNTASKNFGRYIVVGLPIYDDRVKKVDAYKQVDPMEKMVVWNESSDFFNQGVLRDQRTVNYRYDFLPLFITAVEQGYQGGAFLYDYQINNTAKPSDEELKAERKRHLADFYVAQYRNGPEIADPSIVYLKFINQSVRVFGSAFPKPFEFNTVKQTDGWTYNSGIDNFQGGSTGAVWGFFVKSTDSLITSPPVNIDAQQVKTIRIKMANDHNPDTTFQLFWASGSNALNTNYDSPNSITQTVAATGGWVEYTLNVGANPNWTGSITKLAIRPLRKPSINGFGIDYIRFENSEAIMTSTTFDNSSAGSWTISNATKITNSDPNGVLQLKPSSAAMSLTRAGMKLDASVAKRIDIRVKNASPGKTLTFYWARAGEGFTSDRSIKITIPNNGAWGNYSLNLLGHPNWNGTITQVKIVPLDTVDTNSSYSFDSINFVKPGLVNYTP